MKKLVAIALLIGAVILVQTLRKPRTPLTVNEAQLKGVVRTSLDSPTPSKEQLDRKARSMAIVKALGIPSLDTLPVVEEEKTIAPRSADEIAKRCIALAICAVKGESGDQKLAQDMIQHFSADAFFSPKEKTFVYNASSEKKELLQFSWQYERLHVLLWALGYIDQLKPANEQCDVSADMKILHDKTLPQLIAGAKVRPMSEILDQADLYYRLDWAAIDLRLKSKKSDKIDGEIIVERHHALNWLIRYMKQEWDDVSTDT